MFNLGQSAQFESRSDSVTRKTRLSKDHVEDVDQKVWVSFLAITIVLMAKTLKSVAHRDSLTV